MYVFKGIVIIAIILLVRVSAEDINEKIHGSRKLLSSIQKRRLRRLFRQGGNDGKGHIRSKRSGSNINNLRDDFPYYHDDQEHAFQFLDSKLPEVNKKKHDINTGVLFEKFFPFKKSPQIRISANDKEIFADSLDFQDERDDNYDTDGNEEYNSHTSSIDESGRGRSHNRLRTARSVPILGKRQLLQTSLRRINRNPEQDNSEILNGTLAEGSESGNYGNINPPNGENGPNISESLTTPTNNGGVTKVEINLSFGCLFFCE